MRALAMLLLCCCAALSACFPGRCAGAVRWLEPTTTPKEVSADAVFSLGVDTSSTKPEDVLSQSNIGSESFFLQGPTGLVPAEVDAQIFSSAHSCANAASVRLKPKAPLPPGEYTLVFLLQRSKWPYVGDSALEAWNYERALLRRYVVKEPARVSPGAAPTTRPQ